VYLRKDEILLLEKKMDMTDCEEIVCRAITPPKTTPNTKLVCIVTLYQFIMNKYVYTKTKQAEKDVPNIVYMRKSERTSQHVKI
jgi:hypothetical protein